MRGVGGDCSLIIAAGGLCAAPKIILLLAEGLSWVRPIQAGYNGPHDFAMEEGTPAKRVGRIRNAAPRTAAAETDSATARRIWKRPVVGHAIGSTHWSLRKLVSELGFSKDLVHQVWREADLKLHRATSGPPQCFV